MDYHVTVCWLYCKPITWGPEFEIFYLICTRSSHVKLFLLHIPLIQTSHKQENIWRWGIKTLVTTNSHALIVKYHYLKRYHFLFSLSLAKIKLFFPFEIHFRLGNVEHFVKAFQWQVAVVLQIALHFQIRITYRIFTLQLIVSYK